MKKDVFINIIPIKKVDNVEWNQFLQNTSDSTYFCTVDWWNTFDESYLLQVRNHEKKLIAGVPFRFVSVLPVIGRFFKFSWLDSSVLVNNNYNIDSHPWLKEKVFNYLIRHFKKSGVIVMYISTKTRSHDRAIFKRIFNIEEKSATIIVDLTRSEEEIFNSFAKNKQKLVRKTQKSGLEIKILEGRSGFPLIPDYCYLQNKLFEHKSKTYSNIYYKDEAHLKSILTSYDNTYIVMAYQNDKPIVGNIMVSHKKSLYAYLGASDVYLNRKTNAATLLKYEIFMFAKRNGYESYDYGGIPTIPPEPSDSLYGVYMFKLGFGGKRQEFDCSTYAIRKCRYRLVWWLRKFETHPLAVKAYNFLKRN